MQECERCAAGLARLLGSIQERTLGGIDRASCLAELTAVPCHSAELAAAFANGVAFYHTGAHVVLALLATPPAACTDQQHT